MRTNPPPWRKTEPSKEALEYQELYDEIEKIIPTREELIYDLVNKMLKYKLVKNKEENKK